MTTRTADGAPSRDTLRSYIGAFLLGLKDNRADPDDVRAVLDELLPPAAGHEIKLGVIRHWPDEMRDRVEKVWLDLPGFTIDYKLFDLARVLAEFGYTMKVFEGAPDKPLEIHSDPEVRGHIDRMVEMWVARQRASCTPAGTNEAELQRLRDIATRYHWLCSHLTQIHVETSQPVGSPEDTPMRVTLIQAWPELPRTEPESADEAVKVAMQEGL